MTGYSLGILSLRVLLGDYPGTLPLRIRTRSTRLAAHKLARQVLGLIMFLDSHPTEAELPLQQLNKLNTHNIAKYVTQQNLNYRYYKTTSPSSTRYICGSIVECSWYYICLLKEHYEYVAELKRYMQDQEQLQNIKLYLVDE